MKVAGYLLSALVLAALSTALYVLILAQPDVCTACLRPIHGATYYSIHLEDGHVEKVCCPRCGLQFQRGRDDVEHTEAADFTSGERLDASRAFYVESSTVMMCCGEDQVLKDPYGSQYSLVWDRCLPSLVAFKSRRDARNFSRQRGGTVRTYEELQER